MIMNRIKSPYTATITGCAFLYHEFMRVLPLLMAPKSDELLKQEAINNQFLQVNSLKARKTFINEFKRRYQAVPAKFWNQMLTFSEQGQKAALLYAILKTYRLLFDFHFDVTIKQWNSIERTLQKNDIMMEFNELSAHDEFVDSWTELTKKKCASQYLTILRQVGMLDEKTNELRPLHLEVSEYEYYIRSGEEWFLEACLLYPYEINDIKANLS